MPNGVYESNPLAIHALGSLMNEEHCHITVLRNYYFIIAGVMVVLREPLAGNSSAVTTSMCQASNWDT